MIKPISVGSKELTLMKSVTKADYNSKTVLTNSVWEYVELWLRRCRNNNSSHALFYWQQAKHFFDASEILPIESKPLTSYYCCLNATKTLLAIQGIQLNNISHGITQNRYSMSSSTSLSQIEVIFLGSGVLKELSRYLGESVNKQKYNIQDLLYNIPCIHRAFTITYKDFPELFIPIRDIRFMRSDTHNDSWVQFTVDPRYANGNSLRYIPKCFIPVTLPNDPNYYLMKKNSKFKWDIHKDLPSRLDKLSKYHRKVRKDLHYIYGDARLWYIKKDIPTNPHIIKRNSLTLIYAVMHWMSEQVRYNPEQFNKLMNTNQNWLLHEFIENALYQFIDEISCEIVQVDIMTSGYRK